jgi:hypothetical protein
MLSTVLVDFYLGSNGNLVELLVTIGCQASYSTYEKVMSNIQTLVRSVRLYFRAGWESEDGPFIHIIQLAVFQLCYRRASARLLFLDDNTTGICGRHFLTSSTDAPECSLM